AAAGGGLHHPRRDEQRNGRVVGGGAAAVRAAARRSISGGATGGGRRRGPCTRTRKQERRPAARQPGTGTERSRLLAGGAADGRTVACGRGPGRWGGAGGHCHPCLCKPGPGRGRMRWVALCHPAAGHVRPLLPLMAELVARGARVECFATEPFRPWIEATGSTYHAYGEHAWFERGLGQGGLCGGMDALLETSQALLPGLWARVRELAPDAVAYEAHALWGKLLVQRLQRPSVAL